MTDDLIRAFATDRVLAHHALFQHRHDKSSCPAHIEAIRSLHSSLPKLVLMAFRGFAKSTLTEEFSIVASLFGEVRNVLVLGESETRAADRLRAIKHELEYNEHLIDIFGEQVGPTWGDTRIITSGGVCFQAYGRGQSLRGVKYLQWRPDLVILDDVEDEEAVGTPEARMKTLRWLMSTVLPACGDNARIRMLATPLRDGKDMEEKSLPLKLEGTQDWTVKRYPVKFRDNLGEWQATWPQKHSLENIVALQESYAEVGRQVDFAREYMLEATSDEARVFSTAIVPAPLQDRAPGWQARFAAVDPARTARETSDFTGWAVWSWDGPKLQVWESGARRLQPNEIVALVFDLDKRFACAALGVEQDGLDDFLLQPLRLAALERGALPLVPLRAPRGKKNFIAGLQPHFSAREVELIGSSHDMLRQQLLNFPTGHDDAPNALAYALDQRLRVHPRYPDFSSRNVVVEALVDRWDHWLALSCKAEWVAGVLISVKAPYVCVVKDWLEEGDVRQIVPRIAQSAALEVGAEFRVAGGPAYHERHDTTGLRGAVSRIPARLAQSGDPLAGRAVVARLLDRDYRERPHLTVAHGARWTLRALSGGLGVMSSPFEALDLPVTALESLMANFQAGEAVDSERRYAYTAQGRRYLSAMGTAR